MGHFRSIFLLLCALLVTGCGTLPGRIKAGGATVVGAPNAGSPATLNTADEKDVIPLPEGSTVVVTEVDAVPATSETKAQPASKTTEVRLTGTSNWTRSRASVKADTGTVDSSVAKHQIDVLDRSKLLWVAIGCLVGGVVLKSMLPAWPGLSNGLLIAAPCAFAAWKFSEVPGWLWFVVVAAIGLLALGYKRAELDKDGDGIPDILQRKAP